MKKFILENNELEYLNRTKECGTERDCLNEGHIDRLVSIFAEGLTAISK